MTSLKGGNQAEENGCGEANAGAEGEHAPIKFAREVHGHATARGKKQHECVTAPVSDEESAGCSKGGEDQACGEKLLQQTGATGADGESNSHFVASREGADQEEVTDVGAGDEQDKNHYREHDFQGGEQSVRIVEWSLP